MFVFDARRHRRDPKKNQKEGWVFPSKQAKWAISPRWPGNSRTPGQMLVCRMTSFWFGTEMYGATKNLFAVMMALGHTAVCNNHEVPAIRTSTRLLTLRASVCNRDTK
jgi:hypothetical protein